MNPTLLKASLFQRLGSQRSDVTRSSVGTFRAIAITSKNWVNRAVKNDHEETHKMSRKKWL